MKILLITITTLLTFNAQARFNCNDYKTEVNSKYFYASIESIDHMSLEFLFVKKPAQRWGMKIKILGGKDLTPDDILQCDGKDADLTWSQRDRFASKITGDHQEHHAFYRICVLDRKNNFIEVVELCNEEIGD